MDVPHPRTRYRATAIRLVAYLDERRVEMHFVTETGDSIAIACGRDSIFTIQKAIEVMGHDCPEIAGWGAGTPAHGP